MTTRIQFLGATDTVTGSRYLVEARDARVLVDCGLFQGYRKLRERNWAGVPFDVSSLDAVVLTHAHIDHTGYVPKLCKLGFQGPIYCTHGTADLLQILLPDSGYLQEEDARRANKYGYTRHRPAEPLYTKRDAERSLGQLRPVGFGEPFEVASGVTGRFTRAGHILGSACLALRADGATTTFSGDVGRPRDPIMKPPAPLAPTDYLVIESTYGDRRHPAEEVADVLARVVTDTVERGGVIVVPAFAVGRAQHLLHLVATLRAQRRIPELPVFLDSPMAISATKIFCRHVEDHRLSEHECHAMCNSAHYTRTPDESKAIDRRSGPMLVISASGMATGGRVLHHLRCFLPDAKNAVLIVGYQASGTRGRSLVDGADELKIFGEYVPVRARVEQVQGLSAHADYAEMLDWLRPSGLSPRRVFVTHGEPAAADAFRRRLRDTFGWDVVVPEMEEGYALE
ncbi:MAG: MBL fold metallo-hydrolase [Dehalococcoidia bacterium]|nr:MBL fold metallo-hydrolase [Myxococcales bacterium]MCB9492219.1 MBL fold metallo-hydrolase [Dehalococcoidia bacterium]